MSSHPWQPGDHVTWLREQRGGYGFLQPVDALVLRLTAKRVIVRAHRHDGGYVERAVNPNSLRRREVQP